VVFDFETGGKNPRTCEPLQLAAVVLDSRSLEIKPNSEFQIYMKPLDWNNVEQEALDINKISRQTIEDKGVNQKEAWNSFTSYISKYNKKKTFWGAPIAAGHNITGYDLIIVDRLCQLYGPIDSKTKESQLFHGRDKLDLMNLCFLWFENNKDVANYKLDTLRDYFGLSREGAHNAVVDVKQTALLLSRFLRFHRNLAAKTTFAGVFKNAE
jgi:exonuclease I